MSKKFLDLPVVAEKEGEREKQTVTAIEAIHIVSKKLRNLQVTAEKKGDREKQTVTAIETV